MLDQTFAALADPTRRAILGLLTERELSVGEVVDEFSIAQSAISRHLNVLEKARLIERRRDGQRRICTINPEPLSEIQSWMENYRQHWQSALNRLDNVVSNKKGDL